MKKTVDSKTVKQYSVLAALMLWGLISFMVLAGDENPMNPMPWGEFFLIKTAALVSLALCVLTGKALNKKGLLPDVDEDDSDLF